ncbi:transcriptional regulator, XRE family [Indibacter alkaliphilus LW1]|uniref:Transcriptional regulator, XRE family n=1 Tax=Indibacter alkaliphilus (strain CCUG 57479 / KCTC 22604 / LW1) TaxID=1189612 RepID=S2D3F9_INDAL|nr:helix-turn-helix transcriptional regulator [Indibacter alkaliphilus]EOZ93847.1 transcriptional regulator, XRE family [Indibacter alkaliphilus LW1]
MKESIHHGRNIKRFREMMGIKQEVLAIELGEDWTQKKVSLLEQKEQIEEELLRQVAEVLKVPAEAIKSFTEEAAFNIISNTYNNESNDQSTLIASSVNYQPNFNPLDKLIEVFEENKKLYERLLESEKEKVELLKKLLDK